jgi:DNA-binding Lrp family transcriptional regulator
MEDILRILEKDARTSPERIAQMTGRTVEQVRDILHKAEQEGIIFGYQALVDWRKVGREEVRAVIEVRVAPQREVGFDSVAERIAKFPEVRSLHLVSGDYDLAIQVAGRNIYEISSFVSEKLSTMQGVQGTTTHFLLKVFKENGALVTGGSNPSTRLAVAP